MRNQLTQDRPTLFIDQHGQPVQASSLKELMTKLGARKATKQYSDKKDGRVVWNGYVIRGRWLTAYKWQEVAQ